MIDLMNNNYFDELIESLEIDSSKKNLTVIENKESNETNLFQYTTRSFLCDSDIKKIPYISIYKNVITKFITELIFVCDKELTENMRKKYGLRRSFKLL